MAFLLILSGCTAMPVTSVKYTLGGGLFVPASIEVTQSREQK